MFFRFGFVGKSPEVGVNHQKLQYPPLCRLKRRFEVHAHGGGVHCHLQTILEFLGDTGGVHTDDHTYGYSCTSRAISRHTVGNTNRSPIVRLWLLQYFVDTQIGYRSSQRSGQNRKIFNDIWFIQFQMLSCTGYFLIPIRT